MSDEPTSEAPPRPKIRRRRGETPRRAVGRRVREYVDDLVTRKEGDSKLMYALRVGVQVVRQWARDRCPQQAASLAFQTVLSIVPLSAVMLATLRFTGAMDASSNLIDFLSENYFPVSRTEISEQLKTWSSNVKFETLGVAGLVTTMMLAFVMVNTLERTMNDIWRAERRRPLTHKFVMFYAVVTIMPLLLGTSLYQAGQIGLTSGFAGAFVSFAAITGAGFLANYVLPTTPVDARSAFAGGLVTAVLFEAAKHAFQAYAEHVALARFSTIYGAAIALVPLLLIWIYYSWVVILLGAEVAYATQNLHLLERGDRRGGRLSLEKEIERRVNGVVASRVMVAVTAAYLSGDKVVTRRALADRFDISEQVIDRIVRRLKEHDLIIEVEGELVGVMPARPPHEMRLSEVLGAFRGEDVVDATPNGETRLDTILREIEEETRARAGDIALDELARTHPR